MKKKLQYCITPQGESIENFMTKAVPSTSNWWNGLPNFHSGVKALKDIFKVDLGGYETPLTVKTCPGITDLLQRSYIIKFPCDVLIDIKMSHEQEDPILRWQVPDGRLLSVFRHGREQYKSSKQQIFTEYSNIKFQLPVFLGSRKNIKYIYTPPYYHTSSVPYVIMPGIICANNNVANELNVNCMFPNREETYHFKAGAPICYLTILEDYLPELEENKELPSKLKKRHFLSNYKKELKINNV